MDEQNLIPSKVFERENGQLTIREIFKKDEQGQFENFDSKEKRGPTCRKLYRIPEHQRYNKWTKDDKCQLIESIYKNYIIGTISMSRHIDSDGQWYFNIEDGQSRLTVIQEFLTDTFDYMGIYYKDLEEHNKNRILDYKFGTEITSLNKIRPRDCCNIDIHYFENFDRINRGKNLSDCDKYWCYKNRPLVKFCIEFMNELKQSPDYKFLKLSQFLKYSKNGEQNRSSLEFFVTMVSAIVNRCYKKSFSRHITFLGNDGDELSSESKKKVYDFIEFYREIYEMTNSIKPIASSEKIPFNNPGKFLSLIIMDYTEDVPSDSGYIKRAPIEKKNMWGKLITMDRISENFMYSGLQTLWNGFVDADKKNQEQTNIAKRLIRCIEFYRDMDDVSKNIGVQYSPVL